MRILVIVLLLLHLLSPVFTQCIVCENLDEYDYEWRRHVILFGGLANLLLNVIALILSYSVVFDIRNPIDKINELLYGAGSYQDVQKLGFTVLTTVIISIIIGVVGYFAVYHELPSLSKQKKSIYLLGVIGVLVPVLFSFKFAHDGRTKLSITEVCRKTAWITDKAGTEDDIDDDASYIVISNNGELSYEIDRMYLSDNIEGINTFKIGNTIIPVNGSYRLDIPGDESLNIKKDGGSVVYLLDETGNIIDEVTVPALDRDTAYRFENGVWEVYSFTEVQEETDDIKVQAPVFSRKSGFYSEGFELSLSSESGTTIYYSLDCSTPGLESMKYDQPIAVYDRSPEENVLLSKVNIIKDYYNKWKASEVVDKAFVVRAVAIDAEGNRSDIATNTYFINLEQYKQGKIVSLVTDPENLYGENGIYITGAAYDEWYEAAYANLGEGETLEENQAPILNYKQKGIEWERPAYFELFDDSESAFSQNVGIRIQGNSMRNTLKKRFSLYSRKEYSGSRFFGNAIFSEGENVHSVVLRAGFINAFSQRLVTDRNMTALNSVPVYVFINGEFLYDTYIQEKYSEDTLADKYDLTSDNIEIIKNGYYSSSSGNEKNIYSATITSFLNSHDLSDEDAYDAFCELVNIQSYIDYSCINIYLANEDVTDQKNVVLWRTKIREKAKYGDTRWNWGLYDMDLLTNVVREEHGYETDAEVNTFTEASSYIGYESYNQTPIYSALRKNPTFCRQFVTTFMDIVNTNFSVEHVAEVMAEWGQYTVESYDDGFFLNRASYIVPYMAEEFELTGTEEPVTLSSNISGTPVTLNTIHPELPADSVWTGNYFTDYPVTVTADADNFDHWEITANGNTIIYSDRTVEVPVEKGGDADSCGIQMIR